MRERGGRVLMLGFDGGESSIVGRGVAEGWLPCIRSLIQDGASAFLDPDWTPFPTGVWTTTITGVGSQEHLLPFNRQLRPGTYRGEDVSPAKLRRPPFWRFVSDAGIPSALVNPKAAPVLPSFLGTQLIGMAGSDAFMDVEPPTADPPEVLDWVGSRRRTLRIPFSRLRTVRQLRSMTEKLERSVLDDTRMGKTLLARSAWGFAFVFFGEAHVGGHMLLRSPQDTDPEPEAAGRLLDRLYAALDAAFATLVRTLPDDATVFLVSPQGMGRNPLRSDPVPELLTRAGFLVRRPSPDKVDEDLGWVRGAMTGGRRVARRLLPPGVRRAAWHHLGPRGWRDRLRELDEAATEAGVDWSATRAFQTPTDMVSNIRVNLAGREPSGIVAPGDAYDAACREVSDFFQSLVDDETGKPAVARVILTREVTGSVPDEVLPDLYVQWDTSRIIRRLRSPAIGVVEVPDVDPRTGNHQQPGFLIARGPGIRPSAGSELTGPSASLLDVAPTVLAALGVEPPTQLTGSPIDFSA